MSSITLLGTGTCQIELERRASSVLIELDGMSVLFDCGHGIVQRLLDVGVQHKDIEHIVVSHFHADHVSDLVPLLHAGAWSRRDPRSTDLHICGPSGVQKLMEGFVGIFGLHAFQQAGYQLVVHEISEGQMDIGPHHFDFVSLPPARNHGLRFEWKGRRYAMTGDSDFHEAEIAFLKDVDLAIIDSGHSSDEQIVQLAVASQAKMIVCSHLYRELDAHHLQALAEAGGYRGTIIIGRDLMMFVLRSSLLQPETLFFFVHRTFLKRLGKALFRRALLRTACRFTCLATVERERGLTMLQHGAELPCANTEEAGKSFELAFGQADQFNRSILKFFPHIDA